MSLAPTPAHRRIALTTASAVLAACGLSLTSGATANAFSEDASPVAAGERPAGRAAQKYHHRSKVGAQSLRAVVLDRATDGQGSKLIDLRIGRTAAKVNSRSDIPVRSTSKSLGGRGLADLDLSGVLTGLSAQAGPAKDADIQPNQTLVPVPLEPLLSLGVSTGETTARWNGPRSCVPTGKKATSATTSTADLALLPDIVPGLASLLSVDGLVSSSQSIRYLKRSNGRLGMRAAGSTSLAGLSLFGAVTIRLVSPPKLVAVADGRPGRAKVKYTPAVLQIEGPGGVPIPIPSPGELPTDISLPANPLLGLSIQLPGIQTQKVSENGRLARAKAVTFRISVTLGGVGIADISVAPLQAKVKVPRGGIACR